MQLTVERVGKTNYPWQIVVTTETGKRIPLGINFMTEEAAQMRLGKYLRSPEAKLKLTEKLAKAAVKQAAKEAAKPQGPPLVESLPSAP